MLGVNSSAEGELCNIMHEQTNASVDSSETSTKLLECRLNLPSLVWTLSPTDWSLCSGVRCRLPLSVVLRQLPTSSPTLFSRPVTTSGPAETSSPKPFVWFRATIDKGIVCLADHLHSVTYLSLLPLSFIHNKLQHNSTTISHYASPLSSGENKITIKQQAKKQKHLLAVTTEITKFWRGSVVPPKINK